MDNPRSTKDYAKQGYVLPGCISRHLPYVETPLFAGYKKGKKPKGRRVTNPFAYFFYILLGTIRSTGLSLHFFIAC